MIPVVRTAGMIGRLGFNGNENTKRIERDLFCVEFVNALPQGSLPATYAESALL